MKPFLDTGFLITLLLETQGSPVSWAITRKLEGPLVLGSLQIFNIENGLQRQLKANETTTLEKSAAAAAIQRFRWLIDQQVIQTVSMDYDVAIQLAHQWQKKMTDPLPALLMLWPAMAVCTGASHFLSFDLRTRRLAVAAGLKLLPEEL